MRGLKYMRIGRLELAICIKLGKLVACRGFGDGRIGQMRGDTLFMHLLLLPELWIELLDHNGVAWTRLDTSRRLTKF